MKCRWPESPSPRKQSSLTDLAVFVIHLHSANRTILLVGESQMRRATPNAVNV